MEDNDLQTESRYLAMSMLIQQLMNYLVRRDLLIFLNTLLEISCWKELLN